MKFATARIAILALAMSAAPALAADWGGIKDMGGGVPVPVPPPSPVPTFDADSDWYVGLVLGGNVMQDAKITDSDPNMPLKDDISLAPIFGLDFGRYITPLLRAEIAVDYNPDVRLTQSGRMLYEEDVSAPNNTGGTDTNGYGITRNDTVKLARTTALANLIYDVRTGTRFTPYIGGGLGFSWRRLTRTFSESSTCSQSADFPGLPTTCPVTTNPALPATYTKSGSDAKDQINLAAAVQAGVSYDINDWVVWDNGWQMLWEGGAISSTEPSISGPNKITYKDSMIQQFRSGIRLRFN